MSLADRLKASGFKPAESIDGEWMPYEGTYKVTWKTLRLEKTKEGKQYWLAEWDIVETLEGMPKRDSKYADLRHSFFCDFDAEGDEKSDKEAKVLLDGAFTFGVDIDFTSNETVTASAAELIGKTGYIRAYPKKNWKKEGEEWTEDTSKAPKQGISIQKAKVAEKKRSTASLPF